MRTRSPFLNHIVEFMLTKQYLLRTVDTPLSKVFSLFWGKGELYL
ncbi:hypothetical protein PSM_A0671 [Pseudoalteromonas sp. SM9913]|nr:hypothetical protein PSM_A0671 [Pseudoalteromonas sp. SM9913]